MCTVSDGCVTDNSPLFGLDCEMVSGCSVNCAVIGRSDLSCDWSL